MLVILRFDFQPVILNKSPILSDNCDCPRPDFDQWLQDYGCHSNGMNYKQIDDDLQLFENDVRVSKSYEEAKKKFRPGSSSFCHYAIVDNGSSIKTRFSNSIKSTQCCCELTLTNDVTYSVQASFFLGAQLCSGTLAVSYDLCMC